MAPMRCLASTSMSFLGISAVSLDNFAAPKPQREHRTLNTVSLDILYIMATLSSSFHPSCLDDC